MLSILIPSRERAKLLMGAIKSLGVSEFEILVWVDDDDPQLREYLELPATIFVKPRVGYRNFHKMVNFLARESSGEFILLFNDDMRIRSGNITSIVQGQDFTKPIVLNFWDPANPRNNLAPIISREMYKIMKHFSLSTHCDSWVQDIANELDIHKPVFGLEVSHLREVLDDATKQHSQSVYAESSPEYDAPEMKKLRNKDIEKIRARL